MGFGVNFQYSKASLLVERRHAPFVRHAVIFHGSISRHQCETFTFTQLWNALDSGRPPCHNLLRIECTRWINGAAFKLDVSPDNFAELRDTRDLIKLRPIVDITEEERLLIVGAREPAVHGMFDVVRNI